MKKEAKAALRNVRLVESVKAKLKAAKDREKKAAEKAKAKKLEKEAARAKKKKETEALKKAKSKNKNQTPPPSRKSPGRMQIVGKVYFTPYFAGIFEERFAELQEFKKIHGHCNVPGDYPPNITLSGWVSRIRNGRSPVDKERKARLDRLGFVWKVGRGANFKSKMSKEDINKAAKAFKPKPLEQKVSLFFAVRNASPSPKVSDSSHCLRHGIGKGLGANGSCRRELELRSRRKGKKDI